ncbi:MAG: sporulation protein YqfD, partial [Oscillospiraceae bacterium]|nr:sporulation protein YqfD [Oscillospiraceae bacterium]
TFPISKKIMHYKLTDKMTVTRTQEEADAQLQERIERFESNLIKDCTITDRQVSRQVTDKAVTVTISYTLEGEIGREQQLFARYEGFKEKSIDDRDDEQS